MKRLAPKQFIAAAAAAGLVFTGLGSAATQAFANPGDASYENITFEWGVHPEASSKPPFKVNFISASSANYAANDGNTTIFVDSAEGRKAAPGEEPTAALPDGQHYTAVISGGTGTVKADGSANFSWKGSFTVNMYGGIMKWTASNLRATIDKDGNGQVIADLSGLKGAVGSTEASGSLTKNDVVLETFKNAKIDYKAKNEVATQYLGREVDVKGGTAQIREGEYWGAFPQSFVDFQIESGLSSYYYSSGGLADSKKPSYPFTFDFTNAKSTVEEEPAPPAENKPEISVTKDGSATSSVNAGEKLTFTVTGLPAELNGKKVYFYLHSDPVLLGSATVADEAATLEGAVVPAGTAAGNHTVSVYAAELVDGEAAPAALVSVPFAVTEAAPAASDETAAPGGEKPAEQPKPAAETKQAAVNGAKTLATTGAETQLGLLGFAAVLLFAGAGAILARTVRKA